MGTAPAPEALVAAGTCHTGFLVRPVLPDRRSRDRCHRWNRRRGRRRGHTARANIKRPSRGPPRRSGRGATRSGPLLNLAREKETGISRIVKLNEKGK